MTKNKKEQGWEKEFEDVYPLEHNCRIYRDKVVDFISAQIERVYKNGYNTAKNKTKFGE